ncbi:MAG TPA: hypothetical protein VH593_05840 [Ktedonobacteraceae bacterium]|jgi:hypothetical protein
MSKENKQQERVIARWVRVSVLTLTTLGPIIGAVGSRLRDRIKEERQRRVITTGPRERLAQVSKGLSRRSHEARHKLNKRGRKARQELSGYNNPMVLVAGFSIGLLAAAIAAFILIRKRIQQEQIAEEESHIELVPGNLFSEEEAKA